MALFGSAVVDIGLSKVKGTSNVGMEECRGHLRESTLHVSEDGVAVKCSDFMNLAPKIVNWRKTSVPILNRVDITRHLIIYLVWGNCNEVSLLDQMTWARRYGDKSRVGA